jgi:hypothetical protein
MASVSDPFRPIVSLGPATPARAARFYPGKGRVCQAEQRETVMQSRTAAAAVSSPCGAQAIIFDVEGTASL